MTSEQLRPAMQREMEMQQRTVAMELRLAQAVAEMVSLRLMRIATPATRISPRSPALVANAWPPIPEDNVEVPRIDDLMDGLFALMDEKRL